jgi:hypothetical protein
MTIGVEFQLISLSVKSCCGGGTGAVQEPRRRGTLAVGNRYQRTVEKTVDREDSELAVVNCKTCEVAIAP